MHAGPGKRNGKLEIHQYEPNKIIVTSVNMKERNRSKRVKPAMKFHSWELTVK